MTAPTSVLLRCPKCGTFSQGKWAEYMRGMLPLCPEGCKSRMAKATPEETATYEANPDNG